VRPRHTVHPEHRRSCASVRPRHTVHPEHRRSCASVRPRHTVHPEHKKTRYCYRVSVGLTQSEINLEFITVFCQVFSNTSGGCLHTFVTVFPASWADFAVLLVENQRVNSADGFINVTTDRQIINDL